MKKTHTPGPWTKEGATILQAHTNKGICKLLGSEQDQNANARLIAAAPDMFDALQAVRDAYGDRDTLLMSQVKAALAKAKGEA
jgi:hypothetical protein